MEKLTDDVLRIRIPFTKNYIKYIETIIKHEWDLIYVMPANSSNALQKKNEIIIMESQLKDLKEKLEAEQALLEQLIVNKEMRYFIKEIAYGFRVTLVDYHTGDESICCRYCNNELQEDCVLEDHDQYCLSVRAYLLLEETNE